MTKTERFLVVLLAAAAVSASPRVRPQEEAAEAFFKKEIEPLLEKHCFRCHDEDVKKGGVVLTNVAGKDDVFRRRQLWKKVLGQLESENMPLKKPFPTRVERKALIGWVRHALTDIDPAKLRNPGTVALPRLTRDEYANTVRDLLGVSVNVEGVLPEDPDGVSGFANDRASLLMTDVHLQRFLEAAELAVDTLFGAREGAPKVWHVEAEEARITSTHERTAKTLKDGTGGYEYSQVRGVKYQQVSRQMDFTRSGTYIVRVRAKSMGPGPRGGLWIAVDSIDDYRRQGGILVEGKEFRKYETRIFVPRGHHQVLIGFDFDLAPWLPKAPDRPKRKLPTAPELEILLKKKVNVHRPADVTWDEVAGVPKFRPPGEESLDRAKKLVETLNRDWFEVRFQEVEKVRLWYEHNYYSVFNPTGSTVRKWLNQSADELSELTGVGKDDLDELWKSRLNARFHESVAYGKKLEKIWKANKDSRDRNVGNVFLDWFEIEGPVLASGDAGPETVFGKSAEPEVREVLKRLLPRAYRRPVAAAEIDRYAGFHRGERKRGADAETALRRTLVAVLVSPHFLYRTELGPGAEVIRELDRHELAARLSYFLWSTTPDAALSVADLADEGALLAQIDRLVEDDRILRLARRFTEQWLDLAAVGREKIPDRELFREFSWHLAEDMRTEVARVFQRLLVENRSLLDLLESRETFLNERLARLYGIPGIKGRSMRRVRLEDPRRGGLLGMGAVLTATAMPARTSPVKRGVFILEKLLGRDLPPPAANAGDLPDEAGQTTARTLREEMAAHRRDPRCAGCHNQIDPLGLGLENLDYVGRWREAEPGGPVDARGELPDGTAFDGIVELKAYLRRARADEFVRSVARNLLTYALGRSLDYYDEPVLTKILEAAKADGYRARTLLKEIVRSYPFRYRNTREEE